MSEKSLVAKATGELMPAFTEEQVGLIKRQIAVGATDDELKMFLHICQRTGLDPFMRQIYCLPRKYKEGGVWKTKMSIQGAIDGFRVVALRTGEYQGQTPGEWCGPDGKWVDVWLKDEPPTAARIGIHRKGFVGPLMVTRLYDSCVQLKDEYVNGEKTGKSIPNAMWEKQAPEQLLKCTEAMALRKAFPQDLSGIYIDEEMVDDLPAAGKVAEPAGKKAEQEAPANSDQYMEISRLCTEQKTTMPEMKKKLGWDGKIMTESMAAHMIDAMKGTGKPKALPAPAKPAEAASGDLPGQESLL